MPRVKQKVIVYSGGTKTNPQLKKAEYSIDYAIKNNLRRSKFVICNNCNNKVTVIAETGRMRTHRFKRTEPLLKCLEKDNFTELEDV